MTIDRLSPVLLTAAALFAFSPLPAQAQDEQHCPPLTPTNSRVVCGKGCDPSADRARLGAAAKDIVAGKQTVCLLAMIDPADRGYSKKLAIRRVLWVRESLVEQGVGANSIAVELRPLGPSDDKASLQAVTVILGRPDR
ncbi:hypothetical protein [Telmatospirillum sp.]|uniref:hypothetical protein n=1 Tax=Telmatospirillum sp. TaxID=2079197 RepID=UPI002851B28A|nr:hypothetical protein [Telmatospirillum sp.]MDR3435583.1 hypothetical protein [Telmatospirillum sp.]